MTFPALVQVIVALVVCGVVVYLVETLLPIAQPFKIAIRVIVVLALALYLLRAFALI